MKSPTKPVTTSLNTECWQHSAVWPRDVCDHKGGSLHWNQAKQSTSVTFVMVGWGIGLQAESLLFTQEMSYLSEASCLSVLGISAVFEESEFYLNPCRQKAMLSLPTTKGIEMCSSASLILHDPYPAPVINRTDRTDLCFSVTGWGLQRSLYLFSVKLQLPKGRIKYWRNFFSCVYGCVQIHRGDYTNPVLHFLGSCAKALNFDKTTVTMFTVSLSVLSFLMKYSETTFICCILEVSKRFMLVACTEEMECVQMQKWWVTGQSQIQEDWEQNSEYLFLASCSDW